MARTQFKANQVSDFNAGWYLDKYSDIGDGFDDWASQQPMNFAQYIKSTPELEAIWQRNNGLAWGIANNLGPRQPTNPESRASWGEKHWNKWGKDNPNHNSMAYNVGDDYYIMSKDLANDQSAENAFAAWHFDTTGRNEPNRYGTKQAFYDSPGETQKRQAIEDEKVLAAAEKLQIETDRLAEEDRLFQKGIADATQASMQKAAEGAEYSRLASRRGGGNQTLSASGAATFKGRGLKSSENKRGKGRGTGQLRRPYGTSNLSIAARTGAGQRQGTGLNREGLG